mmetsp:Transcript_4535/g.7614  ORF Transcript_4535/g.7614 Transcript_4535/m.7614 type:complete len:243 (+) Transcript_4535:78-806(+)
MPYTFPRSILFTASTFGFASYLTFQNFSKSALRSIAAVLIASHSVDVALLARVWALEFNGLLRIRLLHKHIPSVLESDTMRFRCWPSLLDFNMHMNNANYLRLLNYARRRFWSRNGCWACCVSRTPRVNLIVTASTIRYRREILAFEVFDVVTRLVTWDTNCMYVEHRFVRPSDSFILAVSLVRYRVVCSDKGLTAGQLLSTIDVTALPNANAIAPPKPPELEAWLAYDRCSSNALRPQGVP